MPSYSNSNNSICCILHDSVKTSVVMDRAREDSFQTLAVAWPKRLLPKLLFVISLLVIMYRRTSGISLLLLPKRWRVIPSLSMLLKVICRPTKMMTVPSLDQERNFFNECGIDCMSRLLLLLNLLRLAVLSSMMVQAKGLRSFQRTKLSGLLLGGHPPLMSWHHLM